MFPQINLKPFIPFELLLSFPSSHISTFKDIRSLKLIFTPKWIDMNEEENMTLGFSLLIVMKYILKVKHGDCIFSLSVIGTGISLCCNLIFES